CSAALLIATNADDHSKTDTTTAATALRRSGSTFANDDTNQPFPASRMPTEISSTDYRDRMPAIPEPLDLLRQPRLTPTGRGTGTRAGDGYTGQAEGTPDDREQGRKLVQQHP